MARILDLTSGHEKIIERLLAARARDHLPATSLFVGPSGVGRKRVALGLAQALVCDVSKRGCGECGPCLRIEKKQSEALLLIEPEKTQIKIEQSREILEFLSLRSLSKARIIIIDQAEKLNTQAANTLLKILEEPPADTYFFMIAPSSRHVLPTLQSRSMIVHFGSLTPAELRQHRPAPTWALQSALGSFERLESLIGREDQNSRLKAWEILNSWLNQEDVLLQESTREWCRDRQTLLIYSRFWIGAFRDALLYQAGERDRLLNPDQLKSLHSLSHLNTELLDLTLQRVFDLEQGLMSHRDPQLSFEEFWIQSRRSLQTMTEVGHAH